MKVDSHKSKNEANPSTKKQNQIENYEQLSITENSQVTTDTTLDQSETLIDELTTAPQKEDGLKKKSNRILNKKIQQVDQIQNELFVNQQDKKLNFGHAAERDTEALNIFLVILLVFIVLIFLFIFIVLFAFLEVAKSVDDSCYIATMAYGDINAPEVKTLRAYRDLHLMKTEIGRKFITLYYKYSPAFVERHRSKKWLHTSCRYGLNVLVFSLRKVYNLK